MSLNPNRIDEQYLDRLINDLQQDHTNLFNSLKMNMTDKDREKLNNKKVDKHTKLLADLMSKSLTLKTLLASVKKIK